MESNKNDNDANMQKINIGRRIGGILLIMLMLLIWIVIITILKMEALGGLIVIIPMFYLIKGIWNSFVLQKVKPKQTHNPSLLIDESNIDNSMHTNKSNDIISKTIETNAIITNTPSTKPSWFKQGINFLTFDTPTFRSIFDEGQRRSVFILSFVFPVIFSYIFIRDYEKDFFGDDEDFIFFSILFYLMYFVILLIYIWIREGSGNVRPGGNAAKSLWNLVKVGVVSFLIVAAVAISFQEYERVQEQKSIEEEKELIREKTERFISCLYNEQIDCFTSLVAYQSKNQIETEMIGTFREYDFKNGSIANIYVERNNSYPMKYEVRGQIDYEVKPNREKEYYHRLKNIILKFDQNLNVIEFIVDEN